MQVHCQGIRLLKIEFQQTQKNCVYRKFKMFMHSGVKMNPRDSLHMFMGLFRMIVQRSKFYFRFEFFEMKIINLSNFATFIREKIQSNKFLSATKIHGFFND